MKKFLAFLLCAAMCLAFAACGGNPSKENSDTDLPFDSAAVSGSAPEEPSPESDAPSGDGDTMTLDTYLESIQDDLAVAVETVKEQGLNLEFLARGNSLVYRYQLTEDIGDPSLVKDSLEQTMDEMASDFADTLSAVKKEVPSTESIIVEWLDIDGNVILSKEYK